MYSPSKTRSGPLKVVILGASFETNNMGVNALAAGTVTSIVHNCPDAQICLLDYAKSPSHHIVCVNGRDHCISLANIRFSKHVYLRNNIALLLLTAIVARSLPSHGLRHRIIESNFWLKLLSDADVVASLAGGDSFSDIYGLSRLVYVALPQMLALFLNDNLVLLPQTIGPFKSWIGRKIANSILRRAAHAYSRENDGVESCSRMMAQKNLQGRKFSFCHDMAFALTPKPPLNPGARELIVNSGRPLVGLNVSGLLWMGGYNRKNMFGLEVSYPQLIERIVDRFLRVEGTDLLLIPHVFGRNNDSESDSVACEQVYAAMSKRYPGRLHCLRGDYDESEIKWVIGQCDFFVGARMHACIAALSQGVPAVAIAYSDKFNGVLKTVGMEKCVVDPRSMQLDAILDHLSFTFRHREQIRERLRERMPQVRTNVLNLFAALVSSRTEGIEGAELAVPVAR